MNRLKRMTRDGWVTAACVLVLAVLPIIPGVLEVAK